MPRPKSILKRIEVDVALNSHNCKHNKKHRIQRGEKRLNIGKDRSWERYCVDCAIKIIESDIEKLQEVASELHPEKE